VENSDSRFLVLNLFLSRELPEENLFRSLELEERVRGLLRVLRGLDRRVVVVGFVVGAGRLKFESRVRVRVRVLLGLVVDWALNLERDLERDLDGNDPLVSGTSVAGACLLKLVFVCLEEVEGVLLRLLLSFTSLLSVLSIGFEIQPVEAGPASAEQVLYLGTGALSSELH